MTASARGRARWILILAGVAGPVFSAPLPTVLPPVSPALASLEARIDACAAGLDSLDIGYERIAERCPELTAALEASSYAPWLPQDWKRPGNELSAAGLTQLQVLLQRELAPHTEARVPDVRHLASVLAQLPPMEPSWDARLGDFLRSRPAQRRNSGDGLAQWLSPAAAPPPVAGYVLLALVVMAAAFVAVRELRFWAVRWPSVPRAARRPDLPNTRSGPLSEPLPEPSEKLGALLATVAARLAAQGLPGADSLTARELIQAPQLPPELVPQLATLAGVSEQLAYAPVPPGEREVEAARSEGRQLLAQLGARS